MFRNFTPAWKKFTDQVVIPARNPVLGAARTRHNPFTFIEVCNDAALPTDQRWIWNVTREFGFENGFAVPVHGPAGYVSYVSMGSPESDLDLRFETRAQLQMMALLAHDRCRALSPVADRLRRADAEPDSAKALSDRELECMRWIAAGKTDWEIGMILAISSSTVRFHVDNARRKLDALTRPQAVAILFARGLL
jgi:DNA-binding CsgD family transcriptional regulator